jgi:hypothetical protein
VPGLQGQEEGFQEDRLKISAKKAAAETLGGGLFFYVFE